MVDMAASPQAPARVPNARIPALDIARSFALLAMAIYHVVFDLEMFGYLPAGTALTGGWRVLAWLTASSFLALAGMSLWLAHGTGIRWSPALSRIGKVALAALAVTGATYLAVPDAFVFFGILHAIAAFSLIGLFLLRVPAAGLIALAALVILIPHVVESDVFHSPFLWWLGLHAARVPSVDFIPLFPWMAPFLIGMAVAKIGTSRGLWAALADPSPGPWQRRLGWPGRHSLMIYLIHQPILIALIGGVSWLSGRM